MKKFIEKRCAALVDIDKTITSKNFFPNNVKIEKNLKFFNLLGNDIVPEEMKEKIIKLHTFCDVFIFTGRDLDYKMCTKNFLEKNFVGIKFKVYYSKPFTTYEAYVNKKTQKMLKFILQKKYKRIIIIDDDVNIINEINSFEGLNKFICTCKIPEQTKKIDTFIDVEYNL